MYPDYLVHFNKNHSAKNGRFTSGDGDGDGISNDHSHDSSRKSSGRDIRNDRNKRTLSRIEFRAKIHDINKGNPIDRSTYDDHVNFRNGKYDPNRVFVDDAKLTNRQRSNENTRFKIERTIDSGLVNKGKSFVDPNAENWADEQKLSGTDEGRELVRRSLGFAIIDMSEDDEEEKRKKKGTIIQRTWNQNGDIKSRRRNRHN